MGGIQTIVLGDFFQLSPVPNKWNDDDGAYAFQSKNWEKIIPHKIVLANVKRQHDDAFIAAINDLATGNPTLQTTQYIQELNRHTQRDYKLYSKRADAHIANCEELKAMDGKMHVFHSEEGHGLSKKMRKSVDAPKHLPLKINAPVILTVNLSPRLVNGLRGTVIGLEDNRVSVYFPDIKQQKWIEPHTFYTFDSRKNKNIFICKQIPLLLAFAMTIHKSQGMTLSSVSVDCQGAFEPGQISVAISRVRSPNDISIFNYKPHLCPAQPPCIYNYYNTPAANTRQDMSCCTEIIEEEVIDISYNESTDSAMDEESQIEADS